MPPTMAPTSVVDAMHDLRSEYNASKLGQHKRRRNVPSMGSHGDYHYRNENEFWRMLEFARDMDRNEPTEPGCREPSAVT